jgi:hypothetical protein
VRKRGEIKAISRKEGGDSMKVGTGEGAQMRAMEKDVSGIAEGGGEEPGKGAQKGQGRERYGRGW